MPGLEQLRIYLPSGHRFERDRANKLQRGARGHNIDLGAALCQLACKPD
jgi:hypothetical protein